jgi:hypothetical protein
LGDFARVSSSDKGSGSDPTSAAAEIANGGLESVSHARSGLHDGSHESLWNEYTLMAGSTGALNGVDILAVNVCLGRNSSVWSREVVCFGGVAGRKGGCSVLWAVELCTSK